MSSIIREGKCLKLISTCAGSLGKLADRYDGSYEITYHQLEAIYLFTYPFFCIMGLMVCKRLLCVSVR